MARSSRRRGGPGYGSLITFIVLCLVLIAGYIPVIGALSKRAAALEQLHRDIETSLEKNRDLTSLNLRARAVASPAEAKYDSKFFNTVAEKARDGIAYAALVKTTGYEGTDPIKAMTEECELDVDLGKTLRQHVLNLTREKAEAETSVRTIGQAEKSAYQARDQAQKQQQLAQERLTKTQDEYKNDLNEKQGAYDSNVANYKNLWNKANTQQEDWFKRFEQVRQEHEQLKADTDKKIADLTNDAAYWKARFEEPQPKPIPIVEGTILTADPAQGVATIDLGKRQGLANCEKFTVMQVVKGGNRAPKGEIQLVRVEENIAIAHIMSMVDEDDIIMKNDIVVRQKRTDETN